MSCASRAIFLPRPSNLSRNPIDSLLSRVSTETRVSEKGERNASGRTSVRSRIVSSMREFFSPRGALARVVPAFEERPEQAALAEAVERALLTGEHLVAE